MRASWERLEPRERRLVAAAAVVIAAVLAWTLVWEPLADARRAAEGRVAAQAALLDWVDRLGPRVAALRERGDGASIRVDSRSTLAIIDDTARAAGLAGALRRIEPSAGGEVRVDFEGAAFPDLMKWLAALSSDRPVAVVRVTADRSAPGRVDAAVVLRRGEPESGGQAALLQ